ncbi:MAG: hypothetical protein JXI43_13090 [Tissierellales bacterium]|nr:hypothetical protein [Tissierellales bacterium]
MGNDQEEYKMTIQLLKDISLIILGGFVTFIFTLLIGRVQRRQPNLVWRKFPELKNLGEGLSGQSWLIENKGKKSARNVRITFKLPDSAIFNSFEIEPSEAALQYSLQIDPDDPTVKSFIVPTFTQGVSISVSCLISKLSGKDVIISVVGEDILGSRDEVSKDDFYLRYKKFVKIYSSFYVFLIIVSVLMLGFVIFIVNQVILLKHTQSLAELHMKSKDYDGAIEIYNDWMNASIIFNESETVTYEMSVIYAKKGDLNKCLLFLEKSFSKSNNSKYFINRIQTEPSFDLLRNTTEFRDFLKKVVSS